MRTPRSRRGFERIARLTPDELDLPRARARELVLAVAWARAAGPAIARRASAVAVRRGVLEIRVGDERWRETVRSMLPTLAARLARQAPGLGVRKFMLRGDARPTPLPDEPAAPPGVVAAPVDAGASVEAPPAERSVDERLADAMERYLEPTRRDPPR